MKVTRYEWIHSLGKEELAKVLCNLLDWDCDGCPATTYCKPKHNGMIEWLNELKEVPEGWKKSN